MDQRLTQLINCYMKALGTAAAASTLAAAIADAALGARPDSDGAEAGGVCTPNALTHTSLTHTRTHARTHIHTHTLLSLSFPDIPVVRNKVPCNRRLQGTLHT